jgi:chromosome segregation ATPase
MRKLFWTAVAVVAVVAFVGVDVVRATVGRARDAVRHSLTADVPLKAQLAEARAQVDAYAESVIRGQIAADNLSDMIGQVEREVAGLTVRAERERTALVTVRRDLEAIPTTTAGEPAAEKEGLARARSFRTLTALLDRRKSDLERLKSERDATLHTLDEAKSEQVRLGQEIKVLAAEIESLDARTSAARTRDAVGEASVSSSGFAKAQEQLTEIRNRIKEKNALLQYYEVDRDPTPLSEEAPVADGPAGAMDAIDAALAAYPAK